MTSIIRIKYAEPLILTGPASLVLNAEISKNNREINYGWEYPGTDEIEHVLLVNINCPLKLILNYIRSVVRLNETDEFDLCDEDHCYLKNVSIYEPHASGLNIFQADLTYLIVMYQRDANGKIINYVPLMNGKAAKRCTDIIMKSQITQKNTPSVKSTVKKNYSRNKVANQLQ